MTAQKEATPTLTDTTSESSNRWATKTQGAAGGVSTAKPGEPVVAQARNLIKTYGKGSVKVRALDDVSVDFVRGQFTAIMGPSGSGKSTLMHCMAALDAVSNGDVTVDGVRLSSMSDKELTRFRRDRIGFIFQAFNLLPTLTAEQNITLPLDIAGRSADPEWYDRVIDTVGLRSRLSHKPTELSGGQQQRVACARALVARPAIIFADEPTGNLDSNSSAEILAFLRESVDEFGQTIVMVTHEPSAAAYADRVLFLADGNIVGELMDPTAATVLEQMAKHDPAQRVS